MSIAKDLLNAMKGKKKTSGYDTTATVVRIEGDTAWVHIPGGIDETPVNMTINATVGETVQVRVVDGSAFLVGNASAPPTNDAAATAAMRVATKTAETVEEVTEIRNGSGSLKADKVRGFLNGAMTQLKTQYDQAEQQDYIAILFENLDEDSDTFGALAIGTQGLMISKTRENDEWVWTTALTYEGLIADTIVTGLLSDAQGTNYWNLDTGAMKIGSNILIEGSGGSSQTFSSIISGINSDISGVETTANSKINTYYCVENALPAVANRTVGDLWVDTASGSKKEMKRWNGSGWESVRDGTIADAQSRADAAWGLADSAQIAANGKNTVFYTSSQPASGSGSGRVDGDIWFDTANGYKMSVYQNGAWSPSQFSTAALSNLDAGVITAGTMNAARIGAGTITGAVTATNLTMTGGSINITTSDSHYDTIHLAHGSDSTDIYDDCISVNKGSTKNAVVTGTGFTVYDTGAADCRADLNNYSLSFQRFGSSKSAYIYMTDSEGYQFPAICYNGTNLWIGNNQTTNPSQQVGGTYISAGHAANGTPNSTAYINVYESSANSNNYGIWHSGNFTPSDKLDKSGYSNTEARVFISNANGTLAVSNLPYSYISGLTSSAQTQLNGKVSGSASFGSHDTSSAVSVGGSEANKAIDEFTVPAGYWSIDVVVRYNTNATGYRAAWLSTASSTGDAVAVAATSYVAAVSGNQTFCHFTYNVHLTASQKYYLVGKQNSGSAINAISRTRWIGIET